MRWHVSCSANRPGGPGDGLVLGEAVVRLLTVVGEERGCLLLLEDLHWANAEVKPGAVADGLELETTVNRKPR